MTLEFKVIANAKKNLVKQEDSLFKVYLAAPAVDGKANKLLYEVLADHFGVKKNQIEIIKGLKSRVKVIKINEI